MARLLGVLLVPAAAAACGAGLPEEIATDPGGPAPDTAGPVHYAPDELVLGVDLSYVNQVLDRGGRYSDSAGTRSPYAILADHGANTVRLRLWHDPSWVRTQVYDDPTVPLYSGLEDVVRSMEAAGAEGLDVALDLHYSDTWADPGRQDVPAAWRSITELDALADSVHGYTRATLEHLRERGLLPDLVQVGNEINCGILSTGTEPGFPEVGVCDGHWAEQGVVLNAGIRAVREVAPEARVLLHIAQPENVRPFFDALTTVGGVTDFDAIGFSYYSLWSSEPLASIDDHVAGWRSRYGRDVLLVETAYPWTLADADTYGNIYGPAGLVDGYPASPAGQRDYMIRLTQQVIDGGGAGVFYWEPAWITSGLKDLWGTGSSWDNNTLFDARGRVHAGMDYLTHRYDLEP